jgi:hypothetical protein
MNKKFSNSLKQILVILNFLLNTMTINLIYRHGAATKPTGYFNFQAKTWSFLKTRKMNDGPFLRDKWM